MKTKKRYFYNHNLLTLPLGWELYDTKLGENGQTTGERKPVCLLVANSLVMLAVIVGELGCQHSQHLATEQDKQR